ncbi:folate-binding protein YgfZ [Virgisporangium ochraceum]|uniref:Folate-binding protein YgfZ n=1 Tax=Virgisporangium ochraceum TaxID=65505 RepID=A0A8J4A4L3_9ACTN|nr:folate-binding protein YgfZ [Virgisporangium ochraceum]GIJ74452.1 folate-binding protein YgfZ [Virgisporangium ochraceum]
MTSAIDIAALDPASRDAGAVAHYGDPVREQRLLEEKVGLVDRSHRTVIAVPGADRLTWLHSLTTQHLEKLQPGQGTELLILSPHGHIEHHAMVTEDGTTTWLDLEPGSQLLGHLERMRFFSQVEPADVTADWALLSLVGPGTDEALAALGVDRLDPPDALDVPGAKFAQGTQPPRPSTIYRVAAFGAGWVRRVENGADLLVPRADKDTIDVEKVGLWAYEAHRVAAKRPRHGFETDHRTLPAEAGFTAPAVHLEKGCYRGQETVARVHHLGRPPRKLVLLHLDGITTDELPVPGTPVTANDRTVGFVGTAVRHHELGQVALALVKNNVKDDTQLRVGESTAQMDS